MNLLALVLPVRKSKSMIARDDRSRLAQLLKELVSGRISNDSFQESSDFCTDSEDAGVLVVQLFTEGFCHDLWPYKLRGCQKLSTEDHHKIEIATLFLKSDLEYEWPENSFPSGTWSGCLLILPCALFFMAGMILTIMFTWSPWYIFGGILCFSLAIIVMFYSHKIEKRAEAQWAKEMNELGDFDVWPFYRKSDYDKEKRRANGGD